MCERCWSPFFSDWPAADRRCRAAKQQNKVYCPLCWVLFGANSVAAVCVSWLFGAASGTIAYFRVSSWIRSNIFLPSQSVAIIIFITAFLFVVVVDAASYFCFLHCSRLSAHFQRVLDGIPLNGVNRWTLIIISCPSSRISHIIFIIFLLWHRFSRLRAIAFFHIWLFFFFCSRSFY